MEEQREEKEEKKKGISTVTVWLMIAVALFFDLLNFLLNFILMGWLASIFAFLTFYVWFKTKGISFMRPKRFLTMGGGFIFELIPALSALPGWTVAVAILAFEAKAKDIIGKVPGGQIATEIVSKTSPSTSKPKKAA